MVKEQVLRKKSIIGFKLRNLFKQSNLYGVFIPSENTDEIYNLVYEHLKKRDDYYICDIDKITQDRLNGDEIQYLSKCNKDDKELKLKNIKKEIYNAIRYYYNDRKKIIFISRSLGEIKKIVNKKTNINVIKNELNKKSELDDYLRIPYNIINYDREEKLRVNLDLNY